MATPGAESAVYDCLVVGCFGVLVGPDFDEFDALLRVYMRHTQLVKKCGYYSPELPHAVQAMRAIATAGSAVVCVLIKLMCFAKRLNPSRCRLGSRLREPSWCLKMKFAVIVR